MIIFIRFFFLQGLVANEMFKLGLFFFYMKRPFNEQEIGKNRERERDLGLFVVNRNRVEVFHHASLSSPKNGG